MRVALHPGLDPAQIARGDEVVLNESFTVIGVRDSDGQGEVVTVKEVLDERRVLVYGRADEERVVELAEALRSVKLRSGDALLLDLRSNLLTEKLDSPRGRRADPRRGAGHHVRRRRGTRRSDRSDHRRGRTAVPAPRALSRLRPARAQGHPALRPSGLWQDFDRQGRRELAVPEGGGTDGQSQRALLLLEHQGTRAAQ
jgi:hypothetical protein